MDKNSLTYLEQEMAYIKKQKKIALMILFFLILIISWFIFQLIESPSWVSFLIYPVLVLDFYLLYRNIKNIIECNELIKAWHEIVRR